MRSIINSTRIDAFFRSTRRDAQELLPHLVRELVHATIGETHLICRIPVEDEIRIRDYDGRIETDQQNGDFVPHIVKEGEHVTE